MHQISCATPVGCVIRRAPHDFTPFDIRLESPSRNAPPGQNKVSHCSRFPIPDSRFPIPDSRFPIPDSLFPVP
ncbi:MAG: hypothetical protein F6K55_06320 [Moorea sp. SIO4A3]|nr:hypothetical protein [Moorena sp. SIO4A3]